MSVLRGHALLEAFSALPLLERDAWVDALLGVPPLPDDVPLPPGAVPYLPCPAHVVARAVLEAPVRASDVFVDLGSGLGRPAALAALFSGATCHGFELQPHLVEHARALAGRLGLTNVGFTAGDAEQVEAGTVFFIYASFNGPALGRVLARLERIAARHPIVLCAVDFEVHGQRWLRPRASSTPELVFYDGEK